MPRSFCCVVPVRMTLVEDMPGTGLPFTRGALKALAHAMVYDAMRFTEDERGFFREGAGEAGDNLSVSWNMPDGYDDLAALTRRVAKRRRKCTTTKPAGSSCATG
jgi:hypothetical protein